VVPLVNTKAAVDTTQKLNVDLTKVKVVPASIDLENSLKTDLTEVFSQVPNKDFACAMVLESIQCCIKQGNNDLANKMFDYVQQKGLCAAQFAAYRALQSQ
jgi:hypothetical protein